MIGRTLRHLTPVIAAAAFALIATSVSAQTWGVRAGFTEDPKQGVVGVQIESAGLAPHLDLTFRPTIEAGFGGGFTRVSTNLDFIFSVRFSRMWRGYFGGGPSAVYVHAQGENCDVAGCTAGNDVHGSIEGLVGFKNNKGFFVEVENSRTPNPSLRIVVGVPISRKR